VRMNNAKLVYIDISEKEPYVRMWVFYTTIYPEKSTCECESFIHKNVSPL